MKDPVSSDHCIGFTDSRLTVPCPEPVTDVIRVSHGGHWFPWRTMCTRHAEFTLAVLSQADGYAVEHHPCVW